MSGRSITARAAGFSLTEVLVAIALTIIVMFSVYTLLSLGQTGFRRESEVAMLQMSTRAGIQRMTRDLSMAGYRTPPMSATLWNDGGGANPDEVTIIYADPDVPLSRPLPCGTAGQGRGGGPCETIGQSSTLFIDPDSLDPAPANAPDAYQEGMVLMAIETEDCNGDGQPGIFPFELTQTPNLTMASGKETLRLNHNPGKASTELNEPGGFNRQVQADCAVIGRFRVISYRVSGPPEGGNPALERRDLSDGSGWLAVAHNIENLQIQYGVGDAPALQDVPPQPPNDDPQTWINRVSLSLTGRSESTNLRGASEGVFDPADTYVRKTLTSMVSLRNVVLESSNRAFGVTQ